MKHFVKAFSAGFLIATVISYALGWYDLYENKWITGHFFIDLRKSIDYYFFWVLPYWLPINIIIALLISIVFVSVKFIYKKI